MDESFIKRLKTMDTPFHLIANVLDPRSDMSNYDSEDVYDTFEEVIYALEFNSEEKAECRQQFLRYRQNSGLFALIKKRICKSESDRIIWWKEFGSKSIELQKVALTLLNISASAAEVERSFYIQKAILGSTRHSLDHMRHKKLTAIRCNRVTNARIDYTYDLDSRVVNCFTSEVGQFILEDSLTPYCEEVEVSTAMDNSSDEDEPAYSSLHHSSPQQSPSHDPPSPQRTQTYVPPANAYLNLINGHTYTCREPEL